jgi:hypothetical protein
METEHSGHEQPLASLHALASELRSRGLSAEVRGAETPSPELRASAGQGTSALRERITCRITGGVWEFCWSWGQPIAHADDPAAAAGVIAGALHPVQDAT